MNNKGQLAKLLSMVSVLVPLVIILGAYLFFASVVEKPHVPSFSDSVASEPVFAQTIPLAGKELTILEGLLRHQGRAPEGFDRAFADALKVYLQGRPLLSGSQGVDCMALSLTQDNQAYQLFLVKDTRPGAKVSAANDFGKLEVHESVEVLVNEKILASLRSTCTVGKGLDEATFSQFACSLNEHLAAAYERLPRVSLFINGTTVEIAYYYGTCTGRKL